MNTTPTKSRKAPTRTAHVQQLGRTCVLWLTVDKLVTAYRVTRLPHDFGSAAFRLEKADQGDGQPEVYDVLLDGQESRCDCKGFERHGMSAQGGTGCKHVAGLAAAYLAGRLPLPHKDCEEDRS
jgi:hypothetical protein